MLCSDSESEIIEGSAFYESCSVPVDGVRPVARKYPVSQETVQDKKVTTNIWLCPDGAYRWVYEYDMLRNPTILITVYKVLGISFGAVYLFMLLVELIGGNIDSLTKLWKLTWPFLILTAVFLVIGLIAYLIVAAMYGWKYQVLFEMTDEYVKHIQMPRQFQKAEAAAWLTAFVGAVAGKTTTMAAGLLSSSKNTSTSEFKSVEIVKVRRKQHTIHVNQLLDKNQVYAEDTDFDFVERFILARCVKAKIK